MAWDLDHIVALCNGGKNTESNLAPVLRDKHKAKTKIDRRVKAKNDRVRKRHLGIKKRRKTIAGRKFDGTPIPSRWVS
jgi:5-methylcytosine-specific restriction enzyme A